MPEEQAKDSAAPIEVVLCIDSDAYVRLAAIIRHLSVGLIDLSARIRILTSAPDFEELSFGPLQTLVYQEPRWPLHKRRVRRILSLVEDRPPDIVHVVSAGALATGRQIAERFDADLVFHLTSFDDVEALDATSEARVSFTSDGPPGDVQARTINHLICGSDRIAERVMHRRAAVAREGEPPVTLIRPGLLAGSKPVCFSVPDRVPTILCTARMEAALGADLLLGATARLADAGHKPMVFMLGAGSAESTLRKMVHHLGLTDRVTFARPIADPFAVMAGADVYVQPESERALWAKPLQAMATGLAVVTVEGCASDAYRDGITAAVCRDRTVDGVAANIERLLTDHDYARRLAKGGQDHIRQNHSLSAMAEQTMAIYRQLAVRRSTYALTR